MPDTSQPPSGRFDESSLRSALARVQSRLGAEGSGSVSGGAPVAGVQPIHPLAAINLLARTWGLPAGAAPVAGAPSAGPGAMIAAGARLGLTMASENRGPGQLRPSDCPCIVMTAAGLAHAVLRVNEDGFLGIATDNGPVAVAAKDLAGGASGTIFRIGREAASPSDRSKASASQGAEVPQASAGPVVRRMVTALLAQRKLLVSLVVSSILINLLGLFMPMFSMTVFDRVIPHGAMETLWALALGITAALVLEMAIRHARLKLGDAVVQNISQSVQGELAARQLTAPSADLPRQSGGLIQPASELDAMAQITPSLVAGFLVDLPFFILMLLLIASLGGAVVMAPVVGCVLLVGIHVLAHAMAHRASRVQGPLTRRQQQHLIDMIVAQERIRLTGAAGAMLARFEQTQDDAGYASHQVRYWHGFAAQASAVVVQLVVVATIVVGALQVTSAAMTLGALTACMLLVSRSMLPLAGLVGLSFKVLQLIQAAGQVGRHLTAEPEAGGGESGLAAQKIQGRIELSGVGFTYPGEDRAALQNINLTIRPGERVGLVGKSGCGKSTLLRLLVRLDDAGEGRIKLDEREIRQYDPATLRQVIGLMPQETALTEGTLQDNLLLGLPQVDEALFESVTRLTGVHAIAAQRPQGYSLSVGPNGQRLSMGERQCVSLARTLMGQPRLLLLDEPTSAFDNGHEQRLVNELRQLPQDMGMIIATHRMALLGLVDRVIWIDCGRVVADGPRDEVFKRHGLAA